MSHLKDKLPHSKKSSYINLNSFNYSSEPVDSLQSLFELTWEIKSLQISDHGAVGVLFIETTIGSFVLKMNNDSPTDIFFNQVAQLLDLNVPEIIVIPCYDDFFQKIVFEIQKFAQKDEALSMRLRKRMDFPFYQLMQYIPSINLIQVGKNRFQKFMLSQFMLRQMGICIGFDLIINNSDRFKLSKIWSSNNDGNVANVLINVPNHYMYSRDQVSKRQNIQIPLDEYYFIDHSGNLLDIEKNKLASQNFTKYIDKVMIFQDQLIQFIRKQLPCPEPFEGLTYQIQLYTKYRLSQRDITFVVEGIIYATSMFIDIFENKQIHTVLENLFRGNQQQSNRSEVKYWNDYWNTDLAKISLKHMEIYHLKVSATYATYTEIINEIKQRVAKNITQQKSYQQKQQKRSRRNSENINRPNSRKSQKSQQSVKTVDKQQQNKAENGSNKQDLQNQNIPEEKPKDRQSQKPPKGAQKQKIEEPKAKNKFKQRLQAFQKKNYDLADSQNI